jgi:hypothetical protein
MTGVPMMRPMFLEFPADAECYEPAAEAQYLPSTLSPIAAFRQKMNSRIINYKCLSFC